MQYFTCWTKLRNLFVTIFFFGRDIASRNWWLSSKSGWGGPYLATRIYTVVWACACLCTGPPEGAEAAPLHNPNPTSSKPNSKNLDLCWNFWPKFGRQTFLQVAFRCHALYKLWNYINLHFLYGFNSFKFTMISSILWYKSLLSHNTILM